MILDVASSTYFSARDSATAIVRTLVEGATPEELVERLVSRYDVTEETAATDVRRFLDQLTTQNLLEPVPT